MECIMSTDEIKSLTKTIRCLDKTMNDLKTELAVYNSEMSHKVNDVDCEKHRREMAESAGKKDSVPPGGATVKISSGMMQKLKIAGVGMLIALVGGSSAVEIVQKILDAIK